MFIVLLASMVNASNHTRCVSFSNQKCKIQPTLINLHSNQYIQEFHYYPFAVKLDRCVASCNTLNDLSIKICIPNKTEDLNLSIFNIITGIDKSKTLLKHISCECKCNLMKQNVSQINSGITINVDVTVKNLIYVKRLCLQFC